MAKIYFLVTVFLMTTLAKDVRSECEIPEKVRGKWYSFENEQDTYTRIGESHMSRNGGDKLECTDIMKIKNHDYLIVFDNKSCFFCVKIYMRAINIAEKQEGPCRSLPEGETLDAKSFCENTDFEQDLVTLFYQEEIVGSGRARVRCRSALEGAWKFTYSKSSGSLEKCETQGSTLQVCQIPEEHESNEVMKMSYRKCGEFPYDRDEDVNYVCLGSWYVDNKHYFAVYNESETKDREKYRCLAKYDNNTNLLAMSETPECHTLNNLRDSPQIFHLSPIHLGPIEPGCRLPKNFTGEWIDSASIYHDTVINETHIVVSEESNGKLKYTYVCKEKQGNKYVMARKSVEGCIHDYVCFEFLYNEKNIIRYNKGKVTRHRQLDKACVFSPEEGQRYEYFSKKHPEPIGCPIEGRYKFTQSGRYPLVRRMPQYQGITLPPRPGTSCKENVSDFTVINSTESKFLLTFSYCIRVDSNGKSVPSFQPDITMRCIAKWKEDNNSYMIVYDEFDPLRENFCWQYKDVNDNEMSISSSTRACFIEATANKIYTPLITLNLTKYD